MSSSSLTRRSFLAKTVKATGGVITIGALARHAKAVAQETAGSGHAYTSMDAHQGKTVEALVERVFPRDARGPGAFDAHVHVYIDRALASHRAEYKDAYIKGITALDQYCETLLTRSFVDLTDKEKDTVLANMDKRDAPAEWPQTSGSDPRDFLRMVVAHTMEGLFSDPSYGGNYDKIGWKLVNFPGRAPFGYDPPFSEYDMTIPMLEYPAFMPYSGPKKSVRIGDEKPKKR